MTFFFTFFLLDVNLIDFSYLRLPSNTYIMYKKIVFVVIFTLTFMSNHLLYSQSFNDFSNVNFSQVSDSELDLLMRRASSQGYTQFDLLKIARAQGLTQAEIEKLDKRFKSAETVAYLSLIHI